MKMMMERKKSMSKLSTTKRILCSFIAAAMLLSVSGCTNNKSSDSKSSKANIARKIVNYYSPKTLNLPDGMEYPDNITYANNKIYVSGYMSGSSAENISKILNVQTKETEDIDLSMIEAEYISTVYMTDSKLYVSYQDAEYKTKLCSVDRTSNQIISETKLGTDCYITSMYEIDGKLCVMSINYSSMIQTSSLDIYDQNLTLIESVNINEKLTLDKDSSVVMVIPDKKGSYYAISSSFKGEEQNIALHKLSSTYEVEYSTDDFSDMSGYFSSAIIGKNGNLFAISQEADMVTYSIGSTFFINEVDSATGAVINRYEFEGDDSSYILGNGAAGDYDFIFRKNDGIYGYTLADSKETLIIEFGDGLEEEFMNCYTASTSGNELFMYTQMYGDSSQQICTMNESGEVTGQISLPEAEGYIERTYIAPDGSIYYVNTIDNGYQDEDGNWINKSKRFIYQLDEKGEEVNSFSMDDLNLGSDEMYIQNLCVKNDGTLYFSMNSYSNESGKNSVSLVVLNSDGSLKSHIENEEMDYIENVILTDKDDYVTYQGKDGQKFVKVDYENNSIGEEIKFKNIDMGNYYSVYTGSGEYDFYYSNSDAVYGCNIADDRQTEIINWLDSDINISVDKICPINNDKILCSAYDQETGKQSIYILDRVDEETLKKVQSRQIITVAGVDVMYSGLADEITEFNKNSDKYRLQINDYGKYSEYTESSYVSGAKKLNTDIAQGDIPDIVIGNYEVDMESYTSKGMFTDILALIDKDKDISKDDYLENIFDIYTVDGKMYQLVTNFTISSMIGKTADVGKKSGWSFDDFFKFTESRDNKDIFYKCSKEELLESLLIRNLSEFVNFKDGKCDFDNDTFVKLIEFINKNGIEPEEGMDPRGFKYGQNDEDYKSYSNRFHDGKCVLEAIELNGFDQYNSMLLGAIGEPATLIGIPSVSGEGNGAMVSASTSVAISEKSDKKDGAWEFVRELLLDDYQDGLNKEYVNTFPVKKSALDKIIGIAQKQGSQGMIEGPDGEYIEMKPIDTESAQMIIDLAKSTDKKISSNVSITDIINEQVNSFFDGGQTAKEAAAAVQSKVSLYLKEIN